jgi:hypothetical protein
MLRMILAISCTTVSVIFSGPSASGASKVYVGAQVPRERQVSMDQINHLAWDAILRKYVDADGMVDYRSLKNSGGDVKLLDAYLVTLSSASPRVQASRDAQLAFWINAYNAVTIRGILREYPTTSIRNHTAKVFGYNLWTDLQLYVGGQPVSLEQIEHEVLRKMGEPRIHFAIVCASIGCPRLLNEAYTSDRVLDQLERNARDFFARSQNFRYDAAKGRFDVSAILNWFAEDFGSTPAEQLRTIAPWLPGEAPRQAVKQASVRLNYLDYNWNLNDQASVRTTRR